jgi:hypothetical protein
MIVVGLDTASNRWHAVTDRDDSVGFCSELKNKAWDCQVKKPPKKKPKGMTADEHRAAHAFEPWLTGLLMVDAVAVYAEEPLALQNPATTRVLSLAAGALFDRAHSVARMGQQTGLGHELHWTWIDVAHWKRVIVGNGNADKAAIRQFVLDSGSMADYEVVTYEEEPDLYDSRCLRDYGVAALSAGKRPATLK